MKKAKRVVVPKLGFRHERELVGTLLTIKVFKKYLGNMRYSSFAFDFFPENKKCKLLRVYIPKALKERCMQELKDCDVLNVKIKKLEDYFKKNEYELLDFSVIKRSDLTEREKRELIQNNNTIKFAYF